MSIKQIKKFLNKIKRNLNLCCFIDNKKIIAYIICNDIHNQKNIDLVLAINGILIKNKIDRYNFLYDEVCNFLDENSKKYNYRDFKNDICIGKRNRVGVRTMGCCHHLDKRGLFGKLIICEHLVNNLCNTKCISCKLFMCDELKIKYRIRDFILLDYFF